VSVQAQVLSLIDDVASASTLRPVITHDLRVAAQVGATASP